MTQDIIDHSDRLSISIKTILFAEEKRMLHITLISACVTIILNGLINSLKCTYIMGYSIIVLAEVCVVRVLHETAKNTAKTYITAKFILCYYFDMKIIIILQGLCFYLLQFS